MIKTNRIASSKGKIISQENSGSVGVESGVLVGSLSLEEVVAVGVCVGWVWLSTSVIVTR